MSSPAFRRPSREGIVLRNRSAGLPVGHDEASRWLLAFTFAALERVEGDYENHLSYLVWIEKSVNN
jgi:hypothetical protein